MKETEKAYLAAIIDARGSITTNRHLRIGVTRNMRPVVLRKLQELGGYCTGWTSKTKGVVATMTTRGRTYNLPARTVVYYGFGVHATLDLLEDLDSYLTRRREFRQRIRELQKRWNAGEI